MSYVLKIAVIISAYVIVSIIVERVMVLTFVLVNQYTAITVIFAAKSIARFNELKDRKMAEYYLIGTLVSITFALLVGIVVRAILVGGI